MSDEGSLRRRGTAADGLYDDVPAPEVRAMSWPFTLHQRPECVYFNALDPRVYDDAGYEVREHRIEDRVRELIGDLVRMIHSDVNAKPLVLIASGHR